MVSPLATLWRQLTLLISCALAPVWVSAELSSSAPVSTTTGGIMLLDGPAMAGSKELLYLEVVLNMVPTNYLLQVMPLDGRRHVDHGIVTDPTRTACVR